jgi:hypothetical protein
VRTAHHFVGCGGDRGHKCGYGPDVGIHNSVGCLWFNVIGDEIASGVAA